MMQNHAYDFSLASTSQSIRSRQIDAAESSQVSETISHQVTMLGQKLKDSRLNFCGDRRNSISFLFPRDFFCEDDLC